MRDRGILLLLLVSSLTSLASLFMPWREAAHSGVLSATPFYGWSPQAGNVAALIALALGFAAVAALLRPQLVGRLPFGALSLGLGYFSAGVVLFLRAESAVFANPAGPAPHARFAWSYGLWVGMTGAALAVLGGIALRRRELLRPRGPGDALAVALGLALLVSFLLPWLRAGGGSYPGLAEGAATVAALVLLFGMDRLSLPLAAAVAVLVGAVADVPLAELSLRYGVWVGVGCAGALMCVEAIRAWPWQAPAIPRGWSGLRAASALALVVALFLPWQRLGVPNHAVAISGWEQAPGAPAGALALLLVAAPALPWLLETVAAVAILVSWFGGAAASFGPGATLTMDYGAYVGFAATGLLLLTVLAELRPSAVDRRRLLGRAVPVIAALCCLGAVVVPMWNVLPGISQFEAEAVPYGWFTVTGLLLALYLIRAWTRGGGVTLGALALLALPVLWVIRSRDELGMLWGSWILIGLCVFLLLLGWVDEYGGGLESFRLPEEIWRIDRLPAED